MRKSEREKEKKNQFLFTLSQFDEVFNAVFFHLSRSILLSLQQLATPAPRKTLCALARAAGSAGPELLSLAGRHGSAAPAGGNSLLTGRGRDKCPGTESERGERGAQREGSGGGFLIHEH